MTAVDLWRLDLVSLIRRVEQFKNTMRRVKDTRGLRLWNLMHNQRIVVSCGCGRVVHFLPGFLERQHKVPSDTLVYA